MNRTAVNIFKEVSFIQRKFFIQKFRSFVCRFFPPYTGILPQGRGTSSVLRGHNVHRKSTKDLPQSRGYKYTAIGTELRLLHRKNGGDQENVVLMREHFATDFIFHSNK